MIKHSTYYELFASITVPNPDLVGYWIDLGADSKGRIVKVYNQDLKKWIIVIDESKSEYVPPFIGSNGNWWVDNRDTGVIATAKSPYVGENGNWFTYDPINKVNVDTNVIAKGLNAYELASMNGYTGTLEDWLDSLSKASRDAAIVALQSASKADEATSNANKAIVEIGTIVDVAEETTIKADIIATNPPKIVNNEWWVYNYESKEYLNTNISAIGDAFTYKKEYVSIAAMEADWSSDEVELGEYVLINTGNVEDIDDAKVYLKVSNGWKFIVDLSGMQGIQGWSAYEVAVKNGFVGTETEWLQTLKQPALDAAEEALSAKSQVEATETSIKTAEASRVTAEKSRVSVEKTRVTAETTRNTNETSRKNAESSRVTAEKARVTAENNRVSSEDTRVSNETYRENEESVRNDSELTRKANETTRLSNEEYRGLNESERLNAEATRKTNETTRVSNENARKTAETARASAETTRNSNETTRKANEVTRQNQESSRQTNTSAAITSVNTAKTAAETATTNAITAASSANTQANRAKEFADNPPKIQTNYWYVWNETTNKYVNTNVNATGDPGKSPMIQNDKWYVYDNTTGEYVDTGVYVNNQYVLTKAKIETVFTGNITTHNHNTSYYTKAEIDAKSSKSVVLEISQNASTGNYTIPNGAYTKLVNAIENDIEILVGFDGAQYMKPSQYLIENSTVYLYISLGVDASCDTLIRNFTITVSNTDTVTVVNDSVDFNNKYLSKTNGLEYTPSSNYNPATKKYVDDTVAAKEIAVDSALSTTSVNPVQNKIVTASLNSKVNSVSGKGLSTNDYTTTEKSKLAGIASGAQVNVIETVNARGANLSVSNKTVTIPNDISISSTTPTGSEILWVNTAEDYASSVYSQTQANNLFVMKEAGKGLSSNDYTTEEKQKLSNLSLSYPVEDILSYGVEWDVTVADPTLTRIGNMALHKSLPIQSSYRGCVVNGTVVNYYLDPNDWSKKITGEPSVLDGTDGTVRVHISKFYGKSGINSYDSNKRWVRISTEKIDDTWVEIPEMFVDAYRSTVNQTGNKAVSVVNTTAQFRGGGNRTANDTYLDTDAFRSDLGKPRTNISRANMRIYATNAGSEMLCYEYYKWIFYWAWVIEYATFNSQAAYNAELTAEGYHQGGLGDGVTKWDILNWDNYNGANPLTPCGYCNEFGNFTGVKYLVIPETVIDESTTVATKTFQVPRWRGFDNPFGDIWTNLDGIIIERTEANQPSIVYTTTDASAFGDNNTAKNKMTIAGTEVASDTYITALDLGEKGEIIPSAVGGSATTYMCDWHYCSAVSTLLRTLVVCGTATYGNYAGLGLFHSAYKVESVYARVGFRTLNKVV